MLTLITNNIERIFTLYLLLKEPLYFYSFLQVFCKQNIVSSLVDGLLSVIITKWQNCVCETSNFANFGPRSKFSSKYKLVKVILQSSKIVCRTDSEVFSQ